MAKIEAAEWDGSLRWGLPSIAPARDRRIACVLTLISSVMTGVSLAGVRPVSDWHELDTDPKTVFILFSVIVSYVLISDLRKTVMFVGPVFRTRLRREVKNGR